MRLEIFSGYCPKCDCELLKNPSFCPKCGESLIDFAHRPRQPEKLSSDDIEKLYKGASQLFFVWLVAFFVAIASISLLRFYEVNTIPIVAFTVFIYTWIFLLAQLEKLADQINNRLSRLVYLSLLLPIVGTIYCFYQLSKNLSDHLTQVIKFK